ncbi:hypothetical protein HJG54_34370 [Leptolyngbya sp. NK1-12]|uniref:Uncharacterized protein n=1 Tax=Leptolyngbya sp. NK1-12 TaxID=2547451 RepID=A0AA96WL70_9CYAN|nr:hypothetical protein [Leptolyngbya sp. NK1-12]WNZ26881.1 hypothetical protein HJG54_28545 [Leptolyngbya sp. NK1-12]WNZ27907.1 hypothetical protein HJG54_34370 [Leptolyngbya sp. NK1-12]
MAGELVGPVDLGQLDPNLYAILTVSQPSQLGLPQRIGADVVIVRLEQQIPAQRDVRCGNVCSLNKGLRGCPPNCGN